MIKKVRVKKLTAFTFLLMTTISANAQVNLLKNPGFENGWGSPSEWTCTIDPWVYTWAKHTGDFGLSIDIGYSSGTGTVYQDVAIIGNSPYTYNLWVSKNSGTSTGQYIMKIEWYNGVTLLSTDSLPISEISEVWSQKTISATSPANANLARVTVSFSGINIIVKFDDLEFIGAIPPLNVPEGVVATGHDSRIDLKWDLDADASGYNIYRSTSSGGLFSKLNTSLHTVGVYSDFFGTNDQTCYYYTTAVIDARESEPSTTVSATSYAMTDEQFLTSFQEATFRYFWDFAHPVSGAIREGYISHGTETCTTGGTGMGLMAICVGAERGFVTRTEAADRIKTILTFLNTDVPRFHGAWPHWFNGTTGELIQFGSQDGGDLVESSFVAQGLLTVRKYFDGASQVETDIRNLATSLSESIEWDWYLNGGNTLHWLWSPTTGFELLVQGYNECLITYLLAIASPTHPIPASCYNNSWATLADYRSSGTYYGYRLWVGADASYGGPMFFTHYSYLGFDPRDKRDGYANYFDNSRNIALINRAYCAANPGSFVGYSDLVWGLTASFNPWGYNAHAPGDSDNGTITPTAAISSMPYTPTESLATLKHFYNTYGADLWGPFGFYDAFHLGENWFADNCLAIDQGPMLIMIENYRSQLCWNNFMANTEIDAALQAIGWTVQSPYGGTPRAISGAIEAEDYDTGGEGIAYHDTDTGNTGSEYRTDDVDIGVCLDTGGGYNIGWVSAGEWLEYTVDVQTAGAYSIEVRSASGGSGATIHVEFDDVDVTGTINIPDTGGWQNWTTITKSGVSLSAGQHVMRVSIDSGAFNFNWIKFIAFDSDSDGMPDVWETANEFNPNDAADADGDADGDGMSNKAEYICLTDPRNIDSTFEFMMVAHPTEQTLQIEWSGKMGRGYNLLQSTNLTEWTTNETSIRGEGTLLRELSISNKPTEFYRLEALIE